MNSAKVRCQRPWTALLITTGGDCYNCCYQRGKLGNLREQSFEEVWNGPVAQEIRQAFLEGRIPKSCEAGVGNCAELGRT
jgi:MoaA/NifB/PqqE/SkfB family radical SAM enzyme